MSSGSLAAPIKGSCFCGTVSYSLAGRPVLSAYCHCTNCQRLTGCPFVLTMHFKGTDFTWGHVAPHEAQLDFYTIPSKPHKTRCRCKTCGATVASYNSDTQCWSVWGGQLKRGADGGVDVWDVVKPTAHQFYGTRLLDVPDALGKWEGYENRSARLD